MFAQLPIPPVGAVENWLFSAASVASLILLGKKLFSRPAPAEAEAVGRAEFQREMAALRERLDGRWLAMQEKLEHQTDLTRQQLDAMEAQLARLDERTKRNPVFTPAERLF